MAEPQGATPTDPDGRLDHAVLARRAERLAVVPEPPVRASQRAAVKVRVGDDPWALPLDQLAAAERDVPHLAPIPGAPPRLVGLAVRRGRVLPVFDLRALLGTAAGLGAGGFVVVQGDNEEIGLLVDEVERPLGLGPLGPSDGRPFVAGTTADGVPILDIPALLASDALSVLDESFVEGPHPKASP